MNGGVWVASYVALWVAVVVLSVAVIALLRQIGVLHTRIAPMGTHFAGEGPDVGTEAPQVGFDYRGAALTVVAFTSTTCVVCQQLRPSLESLRRQYGELRVELVEHETGGESVFSAFNVRSTPYVVVVDRHGVVRGRGVANSLEQIEELVREARLVTT